MGTEGRSDEDGGVLGSLPTSRPSKLGRRRSAAAAAAAEEPTPRPTRPAAPSLEPDDGARERARSGGGGPPSGTELALTVVQAAGEVAQIGLTVGGQVLRRAVDRLPRP